jgi:hypothetical protein
MTGLLGQAPERCRSAAPGGSSGAAACATEIKRNAQPVLQTPIARPTGACRLGNARTRMSLAVRGPGNTWRPFGHL